MNRAPAVSGDAHAGWYAGLMSGTSLDGIDAVLLPITGTCADDDAGATVTGAGESETRRVHLKAHHVHRPFSGALRCDLSSLQTPAPDELARAARAGRTLALEYAETLSLLLRSAGVPASAVRAVGAHGQTVRHRPAEGYTVQLLDGALLAELSGVPVVCDLRSADLAAGGQGAPLVPAFHAAVFGTAEPKVVVNIGGMANVTLLHPEADVSGFDCGPGNVLMDAWIEACRGEPLDTDGRWAAEGRVLEPLLESLAAHPFFALPPPKSCGREDFNLTWLEGHLDATANPADIQATLAELTAQVIATPIRSHASDAREVLVCGGGALNRHLMGRLQGLMPNVRVRSTAECGLDPMHVEAAAFAWLAYCRLQETAGNLPAVTGARGRRVLGALYPAPPPTEAG